MRLPSSIRQFVVCIWLSIATTDAVSRICPSGYYRDSVRRLPAPVSADGSSINVTILCLACNCNRRGAENEYCDELSGQCDCTEGWMGRTCYITDPKFAPCKKCRAIPKRLTLKQFSMKVKVVGKHVQNRHVRYNITVEDLYKQTNFTDYSLRRSYDDICYQDCNLPYHIGLNMNAWVRLNHDRCKCPILKVQSRYLILGPQPYQDTGRRRGINIKDTVTVYEWKDELLQTLTRLATRQKAGRCPEGTVANYGNGQQIYYILD